MGLGDKWAEAVYRMATTKSRLKILVIPVGITFWFGLSAVFVLLALWLDRLLSVRLPLSLPVNLFLSVPLIVIGAGLCLWTVGAFFIARGSPVPLKPPQKLVTSGLYSYIRNPMLLGWFILLVGLGIRLNSSALIFIFTPIFILLNVLYLKTVEEKEMEKKFGQQYLKYKESVPMFIPGLGK